MRISAWPKGEKRNEQWFFGEYQVLRFVRTAYAERKSDKEILF